MPIKTANEDTIKEAASLLGEGGLVAFPTETVYGLGANALDGKAVARIFEAKGRPQFNPLITHFSCVENILGFVELSPPLNSFPPLPNTPPGGGREELRSSEGGGEDNFRLEEQFKTLAQHFWPGALTLILPRKQDCAVSELVTAGLDTIAVRVPSHRVALKLLKVCKFPIAAPSANASGTLSPTTPAHVSESLGDKVDMILAAGACNVGLESTVLDLSGEAPVILRPGAITKEDIEELLNIKLPSSPVSNYVKSNGGEASYPSFLSPSGEGASAVQVKSPGLLLKHYAPSIPLRMNAIDLAPGEALLAFGPDKFMGIRKSKEGGGGAAKDLPDTQRRNLSIEGDLNEAAANLFAMLRALDKPEHKGIAVMAVPEQGLGVAINDRLKRAVS